MKKSTDVLAGIVLYNPDIARLSEVVNSICVQVGELLLVDNGSKNKAEIQNLCHERDNVRLIRNESNEGIAKALNQICQYGMDNGYSWALTLDHDTVCPTNLVAELLSASDKQNIGIVCPAVHYEGVNIDTKVKDEDGEFVYACMTSGSLTNLQAWSDVGGFNEGYFIDFVDNEFCMKLKLNGYKVFRTFKTTMNHQLGEAKEINIFGHRMIGTIHSSIRCYYMMRNNVMFIIKYAKHLRVSKECAKVAYIAYRQLLFSNHRMKDLRFISNGIRDGIKGITGKIISSK